ncbi:MAG: N-6 DNA methylase [Acidobacteriota bacterium]
MPLEIGRLGHKVAASLDNIDLVEASFLISSIYTQLLPRKTRSELGAFYTPPILAERLLDLVEAEGVDWSVVSVLDPACGGGAFLLHVARRVLLDDEVRSKGIDFQVDHLQRCLTGIDLDPYAAWMAKSFLQMLTQPLCEQLGRPLSLIIEVGDALDYVSRDTRCFDLIVGNPPYGRVRLGQSAREFFERSLFGHANYYSLFLDAALRWRNEGGWVAFVTPTSFLGGQYFSKLRALLELEAPLLVVDVVESRRQFFESVQQETCLAVFGSSLDSETQVNLLQLDEGELSISQAGRFKSTSTQGGPWFLPRTPEQALVAPAALKLDTRLTDLGYRASTGPLVWNRHKDQLQEEASTDSYPLVWAEAVRSNVFQFKYNQRAKVPFLRVEDHQQHLIMKSPCVLVQRTTAKEQRRRLVACALPDIFIAEWDGFVVENHVNVLVSEAEPVVSPASLAAVLNTRAVDLAFRCLSGSVAVSATELSALPLPELSVFHYVDEILNSGWSSERFKRIETLIASVYGVER